MLKTIQNFNLVNFLILLNTTILLGACSDDKEKNVNQGCEICKDGCSGSVCVIECGSTGCSERVMNCPTGMTCQISCNGTDACDTTTVNCAPGSACSIHCEGTDACGDLILQCGSSDCSIHCGTTDSSCDGTVVNCGTGKCSASCEATSKPDAMNNCNTASSCTQC